MPSKSSNSEWTRPEHRSMTRSLSLSSLSTPMNPFASTAVTKDSISTNRFFVDLCHLMKSAEFSYFRTTYMKDWSDIETFFLYILTYESIAKEYYQHYHKFIDDATMIETLRYVFSHAGWCRHVVNSFREYQEHPTGFRPCLPPRISSIANVKSLSLPSLWDSTVD